MKITNQATLKDYGYPSQVTAVYMSIRSCIMYYIRYKLGIKQPDNYL